MPFKYLREERERQGLTQVALADLSGIPQSHISKLESRESRRVQAATKDALEKALKIRAPFTLKFGKRPNAARARMARKAVRSAVAP